MDYENYLQPELFTKVGVYQVSAISCFLKRNESMHILIPISLNIISNFLDDQLL